MTLTVEDIIARCQTAVGEHTPVLAVRDVLDELVAEPSGLEQALGPVERGGITTLHHAADLTVLHVAWTPGMALNPHEHRLDRKSTRLNSSHYALSRMPSSA